MSRTNTYLRQLPPGLTHIDVYWVLRLFEVTDPCVQHAVKKLLADGSGDKDRDQNIEEAWETLDRWREMQRYGPFDDEQPPPDERQEQVRERHDIKPVWQQPGFAGKEQDVQHHSPVPAGWRPISTAPTDGTVIEVLTDETELPAIQSKVAYHPEAGWTVDGLRETLYWRPLDDQRPPDRHSTAHCPDGGACKHKCGLEPCKEASE